MKAVYIHIPFCKTICTYCDFCKMFYFSDIVKKYLYQLEKEIHKYYQGETVKTLYIGGGTPSCLSVQELKKLFEILRIFKLASDAEFTIECNVETLTEEKIKLFCKNGVNRVSIGVQSMLNKNITFLGRHHVKENVEKAVKLLRKNGLNNINLDLIYALPNQILQDLQYDLTEYAKLNIPHISTYSLMIEPNTQLYLQKINPIYEELDRNMYDLIRDDLKNKGYQHYEISNFCLPGYESKHNITYWNNEEYYGFGAGASGYINDIRYDNTKSITSYIDGITKYEEVKIDRQMKIEYEFMLGLRKSKGISKSSFKKKYNLEICDIIIVKDLIEKGYLIDNGEYIFIPEEYLYTSNSILVNFLGGNYGEN